MLINIIGNSRLHRGFLNPFRTHVQVLYWLLNRKSRPSTKRVKGDWSTAALDPGAWYNLVHVGCCRFMAAGVKEKENASNQREKKREAEEADKVEVAPGVTVASLRRFQAALIGPTQGLSKRRRLCR